MEDLFTAAGVTQALLLMGIIEGLTYALFPNAMRRFVTDMLAMPVIKLRTAAAGIAIVAAFLLWQIRSF
ncbi:MAG: DUF2065 family protein [Alphaproteobacteria bacterium]